MKRYAVVAVLVSVATCAAMLPAQGDVKDTVRETILRLKEAHDDETLLAITPAQVAASLTPEERAVLGEQFLAFDVDVPVTVYVAIDPELEDDAFWLADRAFEVVPMVLAVDGTPRMVWRKEFPAGRVGLGIHSMSRRGSQYFVVVTPQAPGAALSVSAIAPSVHTLGTAQRGESVVVDRGDSRITALPRELEGHALIRGCHAREQEAHIAGFYRSTAHPAGQGPDQVVLTITEDPSTSMSIQWRTGLDVEAGTVRYRLEGTANHLETAAETIRVEDIGLIHDAANRRHSATLTGLAPGATYLYSVGSGDAWSEPARFATAPAGRAPFSFLYMGDIQQGYDRWAAVARQALQTCPDAVFCLTAGDQVNRGGERNDWDAFFHEADDFFHTVPMAPAVGNHELYRGEPRLYLDLFRLPHNGPETLAPERAYAFECGPALFVVLDGNLEPEGQAPWLRDRLASSDAVWKFAMFHQPMYSVAEGRANPHLQDTWGRILDEFRVDVVFQGHDHVYLRTHPMRDGRRNDADGTVYLVSNAGAKMYDTASGHDYGAVIVPRTSMFQTVDLHTDPHRLVYRAYDAEGKLLDRFDLQKDR